uniref:ubiquitinyl hydrolase 1 n=1 Tax=Eucampia antarctica TaxID=49252 RepID=A0A7S2S8I2_9STRA
MGRVYNSQQPDFENTSKNKRDDSLVVINNCYDDKEELQPQFDIDPLTTTEPFKESLKKRGLEMVEQDGDGNCLFRAVSLQIYGDSNMHVEIRNRCLDYMAREEAHFSQFVVGEPFREYLTRKRINGVHANNPEIQAISELFNRPVEVYVPSNGAKPINIFHSEYKTADIPIRLSYHDGNHYNAVINPLCPTAGLGLGLPGLEPGLADKLQMQKAVEESDELHIKKIAEDSHEGDLQRALDESRSDYQQKFMKHKALALSDLEATDYEIEQAVLQKSLESYKKSESKKQPWNRRRHTGSPQPFASKTTLSPEYSSTIAHFACQPESSSNAASTAITETCASVATAAVASASTNPNFNDVDSIPEHLLNSDEYPQSVQELVMNGFELSKVVKAYELVGNNFDDMLTFLMSIGN